MIEKNGIRQFALIGAAGFVAPRHMKAIVDTGNLLAAALDPSDSVGILDKYFPSAEFFTQAQPFEQYLALPKNQGLDARKVDYVAVCSPNHLHAEHIRLAFRNGADAICEKPIVLQPEELDRLEIDERECGRRVFAVLQLRLLPAVRQLKRIIAESADNKVHDVDMTHVAARGKWYFVSWKGDSEKSGGVVLNIGIHLFDLLQWIFGPAAEVRVHERTALRSAGVMDLKHARVRWFLSVDPEDLPQAAVSRGQRSYRSLIVDGQELDLSEDLSDLHTRTYEQIIAGRGLGLNEARASIETIFNIQHAEITGRSSDSHPFLFTGSHE